MAYQRQLITIIRVMIIVPIWVSSSPIRSKRRICSPNNTAYSVSLIRRTGIQQTHTAYSDQYNTAYLLSDTETVQRKGIAMATPNLNETHTTPCLSNLNPAEPETNNNVKTEISMELLMELRNNAYDGAEANDAGDQITRFLQIIDLVKIPNVNTEQLCVFAFPYSLSGGARRWWMHEGNDKEKGYDNDTLIYNEESSDDKSHELEHRDTNLFFDPYLKDKDKGKKSNHMKYNDNSSGPENFVPNDAPHSGNTEQPNKGMCRLDKFEVINYSIGDNEEFLGIRTLECDSWAQTINGISSIYLDIFCKKDKGWTVHCTK
ncbi:hypothetical protein Tco_0316045 [Tanacetum coccineum]